MNEQMEILISELRAGSLVACIGPDASTSYKTADLTSEWLGLPSREELKQKICQRVGLGAVTGFAEACREFTAARGRAELEAVLSEELDLPARSPLPMHHLLARVGFAGYITLSYDMLLERALGQAERNSLSIDDDDDVPLLRANQVPVVHYFGSVGRPATILTDPDDAGLASDARPLVAALFRTLLAGHSLLCVAFDGYYDLLDLVLKDVSRLIGKYLPKIVVVGENALAQTNQYAATERWKSVMFAEKNSTEYARMLLQRIAAGAEPSIEIYNRDEDWVKNSYFESLRAIRTLPSETQVIEAYLAHMMDELCSPDLEMTEVVASADQAAKAVLMQRPNYGALKRVANEVLTEIRTVAATSADAQGVARRYIQDRQDVAKRIAGKAAAVVQHADSLLLFSQSLRVAQFLGGVSPGIQSSCQLYIAECRPKSPEPFQDAVSFSTTLATTHYDITLIPDVGIGNLISRGQVNRILLGAHEVFQDLDGRFVAFVNTCGSLPILALAREANIPVYVIAESMKITRLENGDEMERVSFNEEEALFERVSAVIDSMTSFGRNISTLNIGYDLCPIKESDLVFIISELDQTLINLTVS